MSTLLVALLALSWTGLSLAILAMAFRRIGPPREAAWRAFGLGLVFNTLSAWFAAETERLPAALLIIGCHLLVLPLLLAAARRERGA
jgi:hypothetical protein